MIFAVSFTRYQFSVYGCGHCSNQVLAQGNFVLAVSEGTFGGAPTSYYDLWRVEDGKIAEHWDVMETIADKSTWQNQNGKF
ncbi:MAG: hypothetical protein SOZ55_08940 [Ruminococcus sp.]|nr:hypothetical protein [Ruminococcus sp.]